MEEIIYGLNTFRRLISGCWWMMRRDPDVLNQSTRVSGVLGLA
ncbi:hypothetical protein PA08_2713 [Cutibacterium modestum P08]|nr:hypothetical protein PA08_2713 [Cutibacterium modestum P08]